MTWIRFSESKDLDNLSNTCGLSFNFENDKDKPSRTSSKTSRDSEPEVVVVETVDADADDGETPQDEDSVSIFDETDQEGGAVLITNKILHKLFVKEFKVVSETGRWVYSLFKLGLFFSPMISDFQMGGPWLPGW